MRPVDGDAVLLLLFAFTVVVISLLLLLQVYMVCFLKRAGPHGQLPAGAGPLLAVARDAAAGAPAVEGGGGEACGAAVDVSTSWACLPGVSRGWVGDEEAGDCVVCLSALGEEGVGGGVRVLPKCRHAFHAWCIGRWLVSHSVCCPICRTPARPDTPAAPAYQVVATTSPPSPPPPLTAAAVGGDAEAAGGLGGAMVEYLSQRGAIVLGEHQMTEELHLPLLLLY